LIEFLSKEQYNPLAHVFPMIPEVNALDGNESGKDEGTIHRGGTLFSFFLGTTNPINALHFPETETEFDRF
jgi:hypothetical protein